MPMMMLTGAPRSLNCVLNLEQNVVPLLGEQILYEVGVRLDPTAVTVTAARLGKRLTGHSTRVARRARVCRADLKLTHCLLLHWFLLARGQDCDRAKVATIQRAALFYSTG